VGRFVVVEWNYHGFAIYSVQAFERPQCKFLFGSWVLVLASTYQVPFGLSPLQYEVVGGEFPGIPEVGNRWEFLGNSLF
jgi:hypothetical protein